VGADVGVGVMVDGPQFDEVLNEAEVALEDVLDLSSVRWLNSE
jgi:SHS2 domain-containing protein